MKFGKSILSPSYFRKPDFDSLDSADKTFTFDCVNCEKKIQKEYREIIGKEWNWKDNFDNETIQEIKQFYNFNAADKSPDGGWIAVEKISCKNCQTNYLIYAGVNENYNSFYKITLQGITEIF